MLECENARMRECKNTRRKEGLNARMQECLNARLLKKSLQLPLGQGKSCEDFFLFYPTLKGKKKIWISPIQKKSLQLPFGVG